MESAWRLLDTGPAPGAWNMAVDEAILEAHRAGQAPPTLRLYAFTPAALSLGYTQRAESLDLAAWKRAGVSIVRRPTGGRAVLHADDFTYAVVASGLPDGVAASYCLIAKALAASLRRLGVDAELAPGSLNAARSEACFATATQADLCAAGKKLMGSAQVRRAGVVLQHGTLYRRHPADLGAGLLPAADVADLAGLLPTPPSREALAAAFAAGFAETLGVTLTPGKLTDAERNHAAARQGGFALG